MGAEFRSWLEVNMQRVVIMIEGGLLTGVYRERDGEEVSVDLIDYDNLKVGDEQEAYDHEETVNEEIRTGKLLSCW